MTHEENWNQNFEMLKAYIEEHHHGFDRLTTGLPDKMVRQAHQPKENRGLLSWAKYQRKRIKAGALDDEKKWMFLELLDSRAKEHTGGRRT